MIDESPKKRYIRFSEEIGKGSYKVVYSSIDLIDMKHVAWNTICTRNLTFNEKKRIVTEVKMLYELDHDNIIKVYASWRLENEVIFITNITSSSLKTFIYKYRIANLRHILSWSCQILEALCYLHDRNIIHRDVKCENIFIDTNTSQVFLGDFGFATYKDDFEKLDISIGTLEYMAYEMLGEKDYSEKVDIYAFGMCLLEMLTLETPYKECDNMIQIFNKKMNYIQPKSLEKVKNIRLKKIIENLLGPPEGRPTTREILSSLK